MHFMEVTFAFCLMAGPPVVKVVEGFGADWVSIVVPLSVV